MADDETGAVIVEEPPFSFRRHALKQCFRVSSRAGNAESRLIDVRRENLHAWHFGESFHMLAHENSNRIHLFACRTTGHPNTNAIALSTTLEQARDYKVLQGRERIGVAKEVSDIDQQIAKEGRHFVGVALQ